MRFLYPDAPGVRPYVFERLMDWYFWIYDGEGMSDKKGLIMLKDGELLLMI